MSGSGPALPTAPETAAGQRAANTARAAGSGELPQPLTPLVGREWEVAALGALLTRDDTRLVTLTGPGGVGKTRLALRVAADLAEAFPDGIWFVPLASVNDPALVAPAIAQVLGVRESGERPLGDALATFLRDRQALLLIDNFEGVAAAAPLLSVLLGRCPRLRLLVTSRAALGLYGEHLVAVPPLALPAADASVALADIAAAAAVRLFTERAQAVDASFTFSPATAPTIAAICHRLDGLPLAIELAAAWLGVLPAATILTRLEARLPLPSGGGLDQPSRLRTMRDAIGWSVDLLPPEEQHLFRQLAVFAGGFNLEAVADVALASGDDDPVAASPCSPLPTRGALDLVAALVTKSLVRRVAASEHHDDAAEPRFELLQTIRDVALELLAESGEAEMVRRRHATWFVALADRAQATVGGAEQEVWLRRIEREHDNLRELLRWALDRGDPLAARMAGMLWRFWYARGHFTEGRRWLEAIVAGSADLPAILRAPLLLGLGAMAQAQGDAARARPPLEKSLDLFREIGDPAGTTTALNFLGLVAGDEGTPAAAVHLHEQALAIAQSHDDRWRTAFSLNLLAAALARQGPAGQERAGPLFGESLAIGRAQGGRWSVAAALRGLGDLARQEGDDARAQPLDEQALAIYRDLGSRQNAASTLADLGRLRLRQGDPDGAAVLQEEARGLFLDLGDARGVAATALTLGAIAIQTGEADSAWAASLDGLALAVDLGEPDLTATALSGWPRSRPSAVSPSWRSDWRGPRPGCEPSGKHRWHRASRPPTSWHWARPGGSDTSHRWTRLGRRVRQ